MRHFASESLYLSSSSAVLPLPNVYLWKIFYLEESFHSQNPSKRSTFTLQSSPRSTGAGSLCLSRLPCGCYLIYLRMSALSPLSEERVDLSFQFVLQPSSYPFRIFRADGLNYILKVWFTILLRTQAFLRSCTPLPPARWQIGRLFFFALFSVSLCLCFSPSQRKLEFGFFQLLISLRDARDKILRELFFSDREPLKGAASSESSSFLVQLSSLIFLCLRIMRSQIRRLYPRSEP